MDSGLFTLPLRSLATAPSKAQGPRRAPLLGKPSEFIAGEENAVVRVLADAVRSSPPAYNPVVLYGPHGVGKSAVAYALAGVVHECRGLANPVVMSARELAQALAHSLETATADDFRTQCHQCDLLLIDDLDDLAKRTPAQQFILAAVDSLIRREVPIFVTLKRPPRAIPGLLPKLAGRLTSGLVVGLAPPGNDARCELVRRTAADTGLHLTEPQVQRLAASSGLRARLRTAGHLRQSVLELAAHDLREAAPQASPKSSSDRDGVRTLCRTTASLVAKHYGVPVAELKRATRQKTVAEARGLAMYLVRALSDASLSSIGEYFGGRDHTTVLHACRKVTAALEQDTALERVIDLLAVQIVDQTDG